MSKEGKREKTGQDRAGGRTGGCGLGTREGDKILLQISAVMKLILARCLYGEITPHVLLE